MEPVILSNHELALKILTEKIGYAFEGGGVLSIGHAGSLIRLYELGGLKTIKFAVGTSSGSIIAIALALGATSYYIKSKLFSIDLTRFEDGGTILSKIYRLFTKWGLNKGDYIEEFIGEILQDLTGNSEITFKEAYDITGVHLTIPYLSVKEKRTKYADHIITPNLKIKQVARWSWSIPYFFAANQKYLYNKRVDTVIDAGILDNYPLHVLKDQDCRSRDIIGFKLYDKSELSQYKPIPEKDTKDLPTNIFNYSKNILEILYQKLLGTHISKDEWKLTCKIDIGKYKTTDFNLSYDDKLWLFNSGYQAIDDHLKEIESLLNNSEYPDKN